MCSWWRGAHGWMVVDIILCAGDGRLINVHECEHDEDPFLGVCDAWRIFCYWRRTYSMFFDVMKKFIGAYFHHPCKFTIICIECWFYALLEEAPTCFRRHPARTRRWWSPNCRNVETTFLCVCTTGRVGRGPHESHAAGPAKVEYGSPPDRVLVDFGRGGFASFHHRDDRDGGGSFVSNAKLPSRRCGALLGPPPPDGRSGARPRE